MRGPVAWRNWHQANSAGSAPGSRFEHGLYSDAYVVGDYLTHGPYVVINALAFDVHQTGRLGRVATMRVDRFIEPETLQREVRLGEKTDVSEYHGGGLEDEIAALLGLALGIRCQAGGMSRSWFLNDDPLGRPIELEPRIPTLPASGRFGPIVPALTGQRSLDDAAELLEIYPGVSGRNAVALARAARQYGQAAWVAESDPNLAWIQLVGAIETAAARWRPPAVSRLDRIAQSWPELFEFLASLPADRRDAGAELLAGHVRSQYRFLQFLDRFAPDPPAERPDAWLQVDWSQLQHHLRIVYDHRSRALHDGTPFPPPMCEPPGWAPGPGKTPAERPPGRAASAQHGTWLEADTPMLLATFEYIARHALVGWWRQLASRSS
ncbi:hypothetical protein OHB24_21405 [Kribbella sp. NBC_00482]|uniref:hypothetical protein n=1 Tax=Kribbella sp. NBC_00482 TaxID=2975968 RepID=UPI002E17AD85